MSLVTKTFTQGSLRRAEYDTSSRQLDLHFDGGRVLAYKAVPEEVFRRLSSAPNPATYWEDRVAEEYPKATPRSGGKPSGPTLHDLFGDPPGGN
ncbi:KTSC domain-containing protein [Ramlibacter humi]|uniref:KTSC domain-containing protein n=1 Tax=Ramlibacter humi TaxID=2530451 RepID=A0A4Z0BAU6_9BURK|nr:KTSC domain-containing protein [Ramlibacter humi]TFY96182.1 KTSC domain-containing protein [Ramlibacter humi]